MPEKGNTMDEKTIQLDFDTSELDGFTILQFPPLVKVFAVSPALLTSFELGISFSTRRAPFRTCISAGPVNSTVLNATFLTSDLSFQE